MDTERTLYRERTPWPGWVDALFLSAVTLGCYPLLAGWDNDLGFEARAAIVGAIALLFAATRLVMGGLTVLVQESRLVVHLGVLPVVKKTIPFSDIVTLESVRYRPIRQFGGWGLRGLGSTRAWTARGDQAVLLGLSGGRRLYLGSDHPRRLEERIRTVAGERVGEDPIDG